MRAGKMLGAVCRGGYATNATMRGLEVRGPYSTALSMKIIFGLAMGTKLTPVLQVRTIIEAVVTSGAIDEV